MTKKKEKVQLILKVNPEVADKISELATHYGVSRSAMSSILLGQAMDARKALATIEDLLIEAKRQKGVQKQIV